MSQDALGQLKHLKTARARWPFPDDVLPAQTSAVPCERIFLSSKETDSL